MRAGLVTPPLSRTLATASGQPTRARGAFDTRTTVADPSDG